MFLTCCLCTLKLFFNLIPRLRSLLVNSALKPLFILKLDLKVLLYEYNKANKFLEIQSLQYGCYFL